jgi:hypothetical protein
MAGLPRLLVLIGSGEMAPQMSRVHRSVIARLAAASGEDRPVRAAILDTPYGFQENADDLSRGAVDYFSRRLGLDARIASFRRSDLDALAVETALDRLREAELIFSGPGSPSYALRHWQGTAVPEVLADKLLSGGALVAASAVTLTLGRLAVPVYEIYKGGADPHWLPGLNVLGAIGIDAAVIPHWDNAEGGGHDTRFCFLGERRMRLLEEQLPAGTSILGIDEHTALVVDLGAGTASIRGRGRVTISIGGTRTTFAHGQDFPVERLASSPHGAGAERTAGAAAPPPDPTATRLARRVLDLELAETGLRRRADLADALLAEVLALRGRARDTGDYATADSIRDRLAELGVDVTDAGAGQTTFRIRD